MMAAASGERPNQEVIMRYRTSWPSLLIFSALLTGFGADHVRAQPPRSRISRQDGYVGSNDGVRLFYRVLGAARDTLVVLHGGPGFSLAYLADDLAPLAARHTLILYDQRGTGRSTLIADSAALSGERFVQDVEAVRRHFGLARVTLLGHSWGTGLAALYAIRHPERVGRMLLVGAMPLTRRGLVQTLSALAAGRDSAEQRRLNETRAAWMADTGNAAACRAYYVEWFRPFLPEPPTLQRTRGDFCAGTPDALRNKVAGVDRYTFASLGDWDWRPALRGVRARTIVIQGRADVFPQQSVREWITALPNARLLLLDGVGHFPYLEAPDRFGAAVDAFMAGGWPPGAIGRMRG
jgi:proline iminopeptidase